MKVHILIVLAAVVLALSIFAITFLKSIQMTQNCTGYLKRAADATTVETAKEQLQKAIQYLEANNLTKGHTSVLWQTPDEDIEFWYKNLKSSENELSKVDSTTTSIEKTNLLMKLRETLLDNGEKGDKLTVPKGLSRYPNNAMWGILRWIATIIVIGSLTWVRAEWGW